MTDGTAKWEGSGGSRIEDASERAHDYVERAAQTASSGMDRMAQSARKGVDTAAESAKAGLHWASARASALQDRNAAFMGAVTDSVTARPLIAIGVAAAVGYVLGRIMRGSD